MSLQLMILNAIFYYYVNLNHNKILYFIQIETFASLCTFFLAFAINVMHWSFMSKRNVEELRVIKKGEASRILGFSNTAGYKYLDYLKQHQILLPIQLPGLKTPRYLKEEVEAILKNREAVKGLPEFEVHPNN